MEERLDSMSSALEVMKDFFLSSGMQEKGKNPGTPKCRHGGGDRGTSNTFSTNSETTIYRNVLEKVQPESQVDREISFKISEKGQGQGSMQQRDSSSLEDRIYTSDELMEIDDEIQNKFIADCTAATEQRRCRSSYDKNNDARRARDKIIREAEAHKKSTFNMPGNGFNNVGFNQMQSNQGHEVNYQSIAVNENYLVIGFHVEKSLQEKVMNGEYVDFAKLIPKGWIHEDDHHMELVYKGGQTYFVPTSACEGVSSTITNFQRWEQAFSKLYPKCHPECMTELVQHNHIIWTASSTYQWENIYMYNKEFRVHMSKYPYRNWSLILQQAWIMYLKDRVKGSNDNF